MQKIIENYEYKEIVERQIDEIVNFLLDKNQEFSIVVNTKNLTFSPILPSEIMENILEFSLFTLSNYTFTTVRIEENNLYFEAGFGSENFGSLVKVPLYSILQIVIDDSILYLNPSATVEKFSEGNIEKSKNVFKSNPNNKKFE